jgi:hypothetical protein
MIIIDVGRTVIVDIGVLLLLMSDEGGIYAQIAICGSVPFRAGSCFRQGTETIGL